MRKTLLATLIALAVTVPFEAKAEEYDSYKVSCQAATCGDFDVSFKEESAEVAQTRRTRTRSRSSSNRFLKDFYVGGSAGLILTGEALDLGFQGSVFGGSMYNDFVGGDVEFTFGFAGVEDIDETLTLLGIYLNPRFEYKFDNSDLTVFASPGLGFIRFSGVGDSDTEFDFQIKAGVSKPVSDKLDIFGQGRFQAEAETISVEGGVIYNIERQSSDKTTNLRLTINFVG